MEIRHRATTGKPVLAMAVADQVVHLHSTVVQTITEGRTVLGEVMEEAFIVLEVVEGGTVWVAVAVVAIVAEEDDKIFFSVY